MTLETGIHADTRYDSFNMQILDMIPSISESLEFLRA